MFIHSSIQHSLECDSPCNDSLLPVVISRELENKKRQASINQHRIHIATQWYSCTLIKACEPTVIDWQHRAVWSFVFYHSLGYWRDYELIWLHFGNLFYYYILFSTAQSAPIFAPSHRYPPRVYLLLFWCVFPTTTVHSDGTPFYPSTLYIEYISNTEVQYTDILPHSFLLVLSLVLS